ncbi:hypothetical protein EXIGLDRAFT_736764 [Exidia glandulosa HHB12029]|uniref:Uncharacterized protein n=1 Tax=Exidia glandulosa HHB12029 TaxID=1314781 RepID=A0A165PDY7_EXIGL|nr:hypothetical protein EXIGLDRAFT_736764 [Exidia glandulosa HHB12029]
MNHLPSPPTSEWTPESSVSIEIKSLLASTWAVLQQPPPPSIREVLTAYNAKGTGDREMLLAMLTAKSAEDQRIASLATLQNSMLQIYTTAASASAPHAAPLSPDSLSRSASGHGKPEPALQHHYAPAHAHQYHQHAHVQQHQHHHHHLPPSPSSRVNLPPVRGEPSRKRARSSRSPERHSPYPSRADSPGSSHRRRSSSSAHSPVEPNPRGAMAIGSLLSSSYSGAADDASWATSARTSAERSTTVPVSETR